MDDDKDNLTVLKGKRTPNVTKNSVEDLKRNEPYLIEYLQIRAKLTRVNFLALKEEGFSSLEALELSKELFGSSG